MDIYLINNKETQVKLFENGFKWWFKEVNVKYLSCDMLYISNLEKREFSGIKFSQYNEYPVNGKFYTIDNFIEKYCKESKKDWRHAFVEYFKENKDIALKILEDSGRLEILKCSDYQHSEKIIKFAAKFRVGFIYNYGRLTLTIEESTFQNDNYDVNSYVHAKQFIKDIIVGLK